MSIDTKQVRRDVAMLIAGGGGVATVELLCDEIDAQAKQVAALAAIALAARGFEEDDVRAAVEAWTRRGKVEPAKKVLAPS